MAGSWVRFELPSKEAARAKDGAMNDLSLFQHDDSVSA